MQRRLRGILDIKRNSAGVELQSRDEAVRKRDMRLVMVASFFYMMCPMMTTPLITGFAGETGASGTMMGAAAGAMNFCSLLLRPAAGNMADRMNKFRMSVLGALAMLAACAGYMVADSIGMIFAARIVHGVGFSLCSVAMSTWFASMLPREKTGSGMGVYGTMNALSMAISPVIGIKISEMFGYRESFAAAAAATCMILVIINFTENRGEVPENVKHGQDRKKTGIIEKKVLPVAGIIMMFTIPYFVTQAFIINYLAEKGSGADAGIFFPVYAVVLLLLRLSLSKLMDVLPFRVFMLACTASNVLGMICLTFADGSLMLAGAACFFAGGYGIMCSVCQATAILMAGAGRKGLANSTYYLGLDSGMALGPVIGGLLFGRVEIGLFYPSVAVTALCGLLIYGMFRRDIDMED